MDAGKDVFTLMQEIKLPPSSILTESFGKVSWSVRGIYDGYAGLVRHEPSTCTSHQHLPSTLIWSASPAAPNAGTAGSGKNGCGKPVETLHLTDVVLAPTRNNHDALPPASRPSSISASTRRTFEAGFLDYGIELQRKIRREIVSPYCLGLSMVPFLRSLRVK